MIQTYNDRSARVRLTPARPSPHLTVRGGHGMADHNSIPILSAADQERFWSKVQRGAPDECWPWVGSLVGGYGQFAASHRVSRRAHRVAWELLRGPIPGQMTLDHLCRNKACVNVEHLEVVTAAENHRRWISTVTHCQRGHELPLSVDGRERRCPICIRNQPSRDGHTRRVRGKCINCSADSVRYRCPQCAAVHAQRAKQYRKGE
jgi:hypothetical protein